MTDSVPESPALEPLPSYLRGLNPPQLDAVRTLDGPLLVLAGAGTGKTRVLTTRIAHLLVQRKAFPGQILAVTFTNKAAAEMRARVGAIIGETAEGMWLGTFHALAARILRRHAELAGLKSNFTILDQDDQIRLIKQLLQAEGIDDKRWPARVVHGTIERWKDRGLNPARVTADMSAEIANGKAVDIYAQYQARLKTLNAADFGDLLLHTLTIFQNEPTVLAEYHRKFKYVLVDEYQDTNVAQYLWLRILAQGHRNICCVGDDDQCVPAGTRVSLPGGGTKRVEDIKSGDFVMSSHGSGAFGPAKVLRVHRREGSRQLVRLTTATGARVTSTPEHSHFADIVLHDSPQRYYVYLMLKHGVGHRVGVSRIYTEGQKNPVVGFQQRCLQEGGDAVWLVRAFESEADARAFEHEISLRFAVTTLPFKARAKGAAAGLVGDQKRLDAVLARVNPLARVAALMAEFGLDPASPHHVPQSAPGRRRNLTLTLNADRRGATPMHRVSLSGNDAAGAKALRALGFNARPYARNPRNWRFETVFRDFERLEEIRNAIAGKLDIVVVRKANILGKALTVRPAAQVVPGMVVPLANGTHDAVAKVEHVAYTGAVFDLDIEGTHNFVADGVVTHNSIYGWRGAEVGNILKFEVDFPGAKVVRLEQNYRSTEHILSAASALIAHNRGRLGKTLWTADKGGEKVVVKPVWDGEEEARFVGEEIEARQRDGVALSQIAVLVRAGFQTREFEERFVTLGLPYRVVGGPRFYERLEIRDAIAYFRVTVQQDDDLAFERIFNTPKRGLGDAALRTLRAHAGARRISLHAAAQDLAASDEFKPAARRALAKLVADFARWRAALDTEAHPDLVRTILDESGYTAMWQADKTPEAPGRLENLKELVGAIEEFDTLQAFLEHVSLVMENVEQASGEMASLMTLHAAKGLEFDVVFLPGWEEGLFPHPRALDEKGEDGLEEERRLAHVGITRARRRAYVSFAANRRMYNNSWQSSIPSRFVSELPGSDVDVKAETGLWGSGYADEPFARGHQTYGSRRSPLIEAKAIDGARAGSDFVPGMRVFHEKFGYGRVVAAEAGKLEVEFEHSGPKKVMDSFVRKA